MPATRPRQEKGSLKGPVDPEGAKCGEVDRGRLDLCSQTGNFGILRLIPYVPQLGKQRDVPPSSVLARNSRIPFEVR